MMKRVFVVMILSLFVGDFSIGDNSGGSAVEVLETGLFHGDEVESSGGDDWWGVYASGDGFELRQVSVSIEAAHDPILDGDDEASGKMVRANTKATPLFLVWGFPNATAGPLTSVPVSGALLYPGDMEWMPLGDRQSMYMFAALGSAVDTEWGPQIEDYRLMLYRRLSDGKVERQQLAEIEGVNMEGFPALIWAGDLDRDGRLDLYGNFTNHYNVRALILYLSSTAGEGELVGRAAKLVLTGC